MPTYKILGNPVAQGRARFFVRQKAVGKQKFIGAQDHKPSKVWKDDIKWQLISQQPEFFHNAISLSLVFLLPRPKSLPKKVIHHIKKPDLDNLIKAVKDAMKGICFKDDSQIISLVAQKEYAKDVTGVMITIREV